MSFKKFLIERPSAWVPIVMSLAALSLVVGYLAVFGIPDVPAEDEGTAAHIFQLLMGGQVPIILFFAVKWLPQKPKQALLVLVIQFAIGVLAFAPIYILEH